MVDEIIGVLTQLVKCVESEGHHMCFNQTNCIYSPIMTSTIKFISYIDTYFILYF